LAKRGFRSLDMAPTVGIDSGIQFLSSHAAVDRASGVAE
jgi:hypothetical protein